MKKKAISNHKWRLLATVVLGVTFMASGMTFTAPAVSAAGTCTITVDIPDDLAALGAKISIYPWSSSYIDGQSFVKNQGDTVVWTLIVNGFTGKTFNFKVPNEATATLTVGPDAYCKMKIEMPAELAAANAKLSIYPWNTSWVNNQEVILPTGATITWRIVVNGFTGNSYTKKVDCTPLVVDGSAYCNMEVTGVPDGQKVNVYPWNTYWVNHQVIVVPIGGSCTWKLVGPGAPTTQHTKNFDCTALVAGSVNQPPTANAGGPYSVAEGGSVQLHGSGADPEAGPLTYAWDFDNNGSFETSGQDPTFSAAGLDGPSSKTVVLRVTDNGGATATSSATVNINNVVPTIALSGTDFVSEGSPYSLTLGLITDPGADTVSGYKINWGDSSSDDVAGIPSGVKTHTYPDGLNNYTITVDLTDEDGIFTSAGTKALQITNVEPAIALSGTDFINEDSVSEGSPYSLTLGLINDPGMDSVISYQINWGDPFFDIFLGSPTGEVKTHNYADGPNNYTITIDLTDEDGTFASAGSKAVTVNNVTPTIALSGDASVNEGSVYSLNLGAITDPGVDTASDYKINWGDLLFDVFAGVPTGLVKTHTYADGPNNYTIMVDLIDEDGTFTGASSKAVAANNVAPANVNATATPGTINENDSTTLSGSFTDPGTLDTHTVVIAWGDGSTDTTLNLAANVLTFSTSHQYLDDNPTETPSDINSISVTVTDRDGGFTEYTTTVTVNNVAPMLGAISVDHVLVPVNTPINAIAYFTDPGVLDTHTAVWDWEDGTSPGTVTESGGSGSVSDNHTYTTPGVYELTLTVKDDDGGQDSSIYQFVVVYDPSGGFVTGGGWINSAVNSNYLYMHVGGKATFGFVAKYKKGATVPDGNTEFLFKAGNLNFKSTSYDWLIVTGSNYAKFKGTGTINGQGDYKFQIWAGDGTGLNGADTFRIKIWYEDGGSEVVVYDNGMDQAIGGGSIVVHK